MVVFVHIDFQVAYKKKKRPSRRPHSMEGKVREEKRGRGEERDKGLSRCEWFKSCNEQCFLCFKWTGFCAAAASYRSDRLQFRA